MSKTIVFKIWKFPKLTETFVINQIITAIKLGYRVKILAGECLDFESNSNHSLLEEYNLQEKVVLEDYKIPANRFLRVLKGILLLTDFLPNWGNFLRFYKLSPKKSISLIYIFSFYKKLWDTEVFHIQFGTNKHPVDILKKTGLIKAKLIVSFHGHDLHFPIFNQIQNKDYYKVLFDTGDYLVCNTNYLKDKLLKLGAPGHKVKIIPVTVDTEMFIPLKNAAPDNPIKLVTVGRVDELKGQQNGVQAVKLLKEKGYSVKYYIGGEGSHSKFIKELVSRLGLTDNVRFMGKMSPPEVVQLLQSAHIFLMTSVTEANGMQESQGLVTAEAQACGLPVVAFDSGGVKYTLLEGKTGFLCTEKDTKCLAEKVEILLQDNQLRERMGKNAVRFIEANFSENSVLEKWKNLYG